MTTSAPHNGSAWAVWLTGLPASGKSTITRALVALLHVRGIRPAVLESDEMRKVLTPQPTYSPGERDTFYRTLADLGVLLARQGVPVIFDATANRRAYRDAARSHLPRFMEVHVQTPQELCVQRDPKGIYGNAGRDQSGHVPGVQSPYEPPLQPEVVVSGVKPADASAATILEAMTARGWV